MKLRIKVTPFEGADDYVAAEARCAEAIVEHRRMARLRPETPAPEVLAYMWADMRTYASIHGVELSDIVNGGREVCGEAALGATVATWSASEGLNPVL